MKGGENMRHYIRNIVTAYQGTLLEPAQPFSPCCTLHRNDTESDESLAVRAFGRPCRSVCRTLHSVPAEGISFSARELNVSGVKA